MASTAGWASHISGPIPAHPYTDDGISRVPRPRVRDEGCQIAINNRGTVSSLMDGRAWCGIGGERPSSAHRRKKEEKNFIRENIRRMRENQRSHMEKESEKHGPMKSTWRHLDDVSVDERAYLGERGSARPSSAIDQRQHGRHRSEDNNHEQSAVSRPTSAAGGMSVQGQSVSAGLPPSGARRSRSVAPHLDTHSSTHYYSQQTPSGDYLKAHEKTGPSLDDMLDTRPLTPIRRHPRPEKLTVPRALSAREVKLIRRDVDFVQANARAARSARLKRSGSFQGLDQQADTPGRMCALGELPEYLLRRREIWRQELEQELASRPDPNQPPGHRKMSEQERQNTLKILKDTESELLSELCRMPIRVDTLRVKTRKEHIERKLAEIDEALKIFSKPTVFIRLDE